MSLFKKISGLFKGESQSAETADSKAQEIHSLDAPHGSSPIHISFWVSRSEIESDYGQGISDFYRSIETLKAKFNASELPFQVWRDITTEDGHEVARGAPPPVGEIVLYLSTSGLAIAAYRLLKLWVEARKGRKFRVKIEGFEVEATELSQDQFLELYDRLKQDLEEPHQGDTSSSIADEIRSKGFTVFDAEQSKRDQDRLILGDAISNLEISVHSKEDVQPE